MVALIVNVVPDLVFVGTDRGDKVPACPQSALREFLRLLLEPHGCFSFQDLRDVRCRVFGRYRDKQVYVLVADVPGVDVQFFPLCDVLEHSLQFLFDVCILQYRTTVLGTPDHVVVTDPRAVGLLVETSIHGSVTVGW